jgi:anti-sigma B factor antagonist
LIRELLAARTQEVTVGRDEFSRSMHGDAVVVHAAAELDLYNTDRLRTFCLESLDVSGGSRIVVDLTDTSFMDSSALGVFVRIAKNAKAEGGWLRLATGDNLTLQKLLKLTGLDGPLGNYSSVEAAING